MNELAVIILLGILQGTAEFLPVSSSGHLIIAQAAFEQFAGTNLPDPVELNIVLHLGTLLAILVVYWRAILRLLSQDRRVLGLVAVGTLPAVVVGLPLHELPALRGWLGNPLLAGCMLPITGLILLWGGSRPAGDVDYTEMSYRQALGVGLVQAFAILPGISRSGSTIVAGMGLGLRRDAAATFSFLLAIPAIAGASVLELKDLFTSSGSATPLSELAIGAAVSFAVGCAALMWLLRWLKAGRLQWFAAWCIPLGVAVIFWQLYAGAR